MARTPKPSGRKRLPDKGRRLSRHRPVNTRPVRPRFLIVCEGAKTEPRCFRCFRANTDVIDLKVVGLGDNTLSLVRRTCELMQAEDYAQTWCVFDRDSFPPRRFNEALALAQRNGIQVAHSNEAFELWYLLHFHYHDTATSRALYGQLLTERLDKPYRKNTLDMYDQLPERQPTAIKNAQTLRESYGSDHNPEKDNPCTTVYLLVQELNRHTR